jgi:hypothetical protein
MDNSDAEWIDAKLEEIHESEVPVDFDFELWLSSDSKHTVKVAAKTPEGRKAAMRFAQAVYAKILEKYGTKQVNAVREYSKAGETPKVPAKQTTCATCGAPATEREGISKTGKHFHAVFCSTEDKSHTKWLR